MNPDDTTPDTAAATLATHEQDARRQAPRGPYAFWADQRADLDRARQDTFNDPYDLAAQEAVEDVLLARADDHREALVLDQLRNQHLPLDEAQVYDGTESPADLRDLDRAAADQDAATHDARARVWAGLEADGLPETGARVYDGDETALDLLLTDAADHGSHLSPRRVLESLAYDDSDMDALRDATAEALDTDEDTWA